MLEDRDADGKHVRYGALYGHVLNSVHVKFWKGDGKLCEAYHQNIIAIIAYRPGPLLKTQTVIYSEVQSLETHLGVSKNNGTPKSSILIGVSIINHPFGDTTIFGNTHLVKFVNPPKNVITRQGLHQLRWSTWWSQDMKPQQPPWDLPCSSMAATQTGTGVKRKVGTGVKIKQKTCFSVEITL